MSKSEVNEGSRFSERGNWVEELDFLCFPHSATSLFLLFLVVCFPRFH